MPRPEAPASGRPGGHWRGDLAGGFNAALVALPIELVYGLFAVAPLGLDWAEHGLRAALWACVLGGLLGAVLRTAGGVITGTASVTALLLGTLAASLMHHPLIQAGPDPAGTAFMLLLACTALAGAMQWLFGLAGVGRMLKFVPYPVLSGLMCGVATLLTLAALRPALGVASTANWGAVPALWHPLSLLVFGATLGLCFWLRRRFPLLPGPALAMLAGSLLHHALAAAVGASGLGGTSIAVHALVPDHTLWRVIATQGASTLWPWLPTLLPYALAIAALASLESLLCLPSIDEAQNQRSDGDRQLRRLGIGNALAGLLGATMSTSHPARVAINLASGARTQWSGVVYSVTLLLAVLLMGNWLGLVPHAVTAAILVLMASRMVDDGTRHLALQVLQRRASMAREQYRLLLANFSVVLLVALVVVFGDMLKGVAVGVLAAMFLFVRAGMRAVVRRVTTGEMRRSLKVRSMAHMQLLAREGAQVVIIEAEGALFFGTADQLVREIDAATATARWLILDLQRVNDADPTGARSLLLAAKRLHSRQRSLALAGAQTRVERVLKAMGLDAPVAPVHWYDDLDTALEFHEDLLLRECTDQGPAGRMSFLQTALAEGMTYAQGKLLQSFLVQRDVAAGEAIFRTGEPGNSLLVATESVVDILLPLENGRARRIASFAPGVVFGEMALLDSKPRSADAVAKSAGAVWELTRDQLSLIEQTHPDIARCIQYNLSRSLAERLRLTTTELRLATEP
jgi:sulfate permease, SulP family